MKMAYRLLDRIWNLFVNRYDGDDDGECGCGTVIEEGDADPPAAESNGRR